MKSKVLMQLKQINTRSKYKPLGGRSQRDNDKMRVVFAEEYKCGKDCSLI